jgi:hypothetical protein
VTYEIQVFFEGAKKEVFSSILKKNIIKYKGLKIGLCIKYFQVFFKKPKKT